LKSKIQPEEEEKKPKKSKTKKNKNSSDEDDDHDEQKNQNKKQFNVDDEDEHTLHKKKQLIKHQKNNSNNDDLFEEVQPGLINNSKYAHNKKPIFEETKNNNNVGIVGSKHQAQKLPKDLEPKQKKEKRPLNMIPEAEALREITTNIEEIQSQILQRGDNSQNPNQRSMELVNENQINAIIPKKQLHKLTLQLLLKKNNEPPQYYFYEDFSIGAAETNGLVLDVNPQEGLYGDISDVHCVVKINPQGLFELEDCGSEFGTFYQLNSDQKYILEEGQIYQIGKTFIKINMMENDKMKFEVLKGEDKGKEFEIGCKKFIFGSKKKSDFEIKKDKWVSGSHCIFKRKKNGGFSVIDDNSTNGFIFKYMFFF